jgi:hypothetical protein
MRTTRRWSLLAGVAVLWAAGVALGFSRLWVQAYTPGPAARASATWPSRSLDRAPDRPTLVMVLHPECACSAASLEQLSRLLARTPSPVRVIVIFADPAGLPPLSPSNPLLRTAAAIPGVAAIVDRGGRETAAFGARVSGQTFLYDAAGRLMFSGGMTAARAHAGDNDGADALRAALATGRVPIAGAPVFGCLLEGAPQR